MWLSAERSSGGIRNGWLAGVAQRNAMAGVMAQ